MHIGKPPIPSSEINFSNGCRMQKESITNHLRKLCKYMYWLLQCSELCTQSSERTYGCMLLCHVVLHLASAPVVQNSAEGTCSLNNFNI